MPKSPTRSAEKIAVSAGPITVGPTNATLRIAAWCLALALVIFSVVLLRFTPRFSYWVGLDLVGVLESPQYGRARATLAQVEDPWAPIPGKLHAVIRWRALFPMTWHYLKLPRWLLLSMPPVGCVLTLWLVAWLTYTRFHSVRVTVLAPLLFAMLPWFFVSTGWLLYFDSWCVLAELAVAFVPCNWVVGAACLAAPWIDERFILALPICLGVRAVMFAGNGPSFRREAVTTLVIVTLATFPYLLVRALAWLYEDPQTLAYVRNHWAEAPRVPLSRYAAGLWSGFRAGWMMVALGCALAARRLGWFGGTAFILLTIITALTSLFIAQDISRTLMTLCPVLLLGIFLWERQRSPRLGLLLPCIVVANLLLPAAHVMWDQQIPVDWLPIEIARYRKPPPVFTAARLIAEAEQLINAGDSQAGEAKLNQAIELDRRYAIAFVKRASLRMARDETAAAEADLEEALKIKADAPTPLLLRGVIRADRGETDAAKNDFEQALLNAPPGWPGRRAAQDFVDRLNAQKPVQP